MAVPQSDPTRSPVLIILLWPDDIIHVLYFFSFLFLQLNAPQPKTTVPLSFLLLRQGVKKCAAGCVALRELRPAPIAIVAHFIAQPCLLSPLFIHPPHPPSIHLFDSDLESHRIKVRYAVPVAHVLDTSSVRALQGAFLLPQRPIGSGLSAAVKSPT